MDALERLKAKSSGLRACCLFGLMFFASCEQNKTRESHVGAQDSFAKNQQASKASGSELSTKNLPEALNAFIPQGYTILDTTSGDLNLDRYADMILIVKNDKEEEFSDSGMKRPLLILIGQMDRTYKLAGRNDNAVYCAGCGGAAGDPFMNVVIKNGYFSVEHYGGATERWTRTITFKYAPADNYWYLHKDGTEWFKIDEGNKTESKIYTTKDFGKVPFDKYDIYQGSKP